MYRSNGQGDQARSRAQGNASLGTINVIFATLGKIGSYLFRMVFVALPHAEDPNFEPKRARVEFRPALSFSDEDKIKTIQPYDNALVVTLRIWGMMLRG